MDPLHVCQVSAEVTPFAKTGGLGDVTGALTRTLSARGHDCRLFMPFYRTVDNLGAPPVPVEFAQDVPVTLGERTFHFSLLTAPFPNTDVWAYFVHCPALYDRPSIYGDGPDEHLRFLLLSVAALESCQRMGWSPDILHSHDWHAALTPLYLSTVYAWDRLFQRTRSILTIHNIGYQGMFPADTLDDLSLGRFAYRIHQEDLAKGVINFLKNGILSADRITTVSHTYAREIQTPEFGMGLEETLRARSDHVTGILNGVDYGIWDPRTDPRIPYHYSAEDLSGKALDKRYVVENMGLRFDENVPVVGVVSRLVSQKGLDLLPGVLPNLLSRRACQVLALGSGEPRYEDFFRWLQREFPHGVAFYHGYNDRLAGLIEAGADLFLMPSKYEPCGLNQMYSLRYGTVPVVRKTGGLADTVTLFDPDTGEGTGIVFDHYTQEGLRWALEAGFALFRDKPTWQTLIRNGMRLDHSWERRIDEYVHLYETLIR